MFKAKKHIHRVPYKGDFTLSSTSTQPPEAIPSKKKLKLQLGQLVEQMAELQNRLYAHNQQALLLIFQAMDAAGKDGTIRAVTKGINPSGCQVYAFKQPSSEELEHDFLWRSSRCLPERGRIGIFNRSYYEEALVVRVHPGYLKYQHLPDSAQLNSKQFWAQRFQSIRDHEQHLARNGTVVLKFWLNVSKEEQRQRFLSRLDEPEKHWKFSSKDVEERQHWNQYMDAYQQMLSNTSRPWAPWYAIPADNKAYMRVCVAEVIVKTLKSLDLQYPQLSKAEYAKFSEMRQRLKA